MGFFDDKMHKNSRRRDFATLALRLTTGGLLIGHGAQKLFGAFNGPGLEGTTGWLESMGFQPGQQWALLAGASEFGGGLLTTLGLFFPVGPIATMGAMGVATRTVHEGKPIWVTEGGAELPITNMSIALALTLLGPGRHSMDHMLGIHVPKGVSIVTAGAVAAGVLAVEMMPQPDTGPDDESGEAEPASV